MARKNRDNKFLRLTGLWPSKRDGLFSGKLRAQDVEKLQEKIEEADGKDLVFFLWENEKESRKDPEFTLQVAVSDSDGGSRRSRRDRDEDEDEDKHSKRSKRDAEDDEEGEEEEDEKEERSSRSNKKNSKKKSDW